MPAARRIFLLSPANCSGIRAGYLLRREARSTLAQRLRSTEGASIGEVFTFMSGLYFRGKMAYALAFADPPTGCAGVHVIVPGMGLLPPHTVIDLAGLRAIARVPVDPASRRYLKPLQRDAALLAEQLVDADVAVLLGSIATRKYLDPLGEILGPRLRVPREFIGRGDMSRGSLMLRHAAAGSQLTYIESA
jgi:hypothetical protein